MKETKRLEYNMDYLKLTRRQVEIHDIIMQSMMNTWSGPLSSYISDQSKIYGISGDPLAYWVADWIAERIGLLVDCTVCGRQFRQSRRDNVYCSGACKVKAWRRRHRK